jgi:hypothetical protein
LPIDEADTTALQIGDTAQSERIPWLHDKAKLTLKEGHHRCPGWEILLKVREIVLTAYRFNEMCQGHIGHAIPYRCQTGLAPDRCQKERRRRKTSGIALPQDAKTWVITSRGKQKGSLWVATRRCRHPGTLFNPLIDECLGEQPFAGHSRAGDGTAFGQDIDLLFVEAEILRHLFGTHKSVHLSLLVTRHYYRISRKKSKKITKNSLFFQKRGNNAPASLQRQQAV